MDAFIPERDAHSWETEKNSEVLQPPFERDEPLEVQKEVNPGALGVVKAPTWEAAEYIWPGRTGTNLSRQEASINSMNKAWPGSQRL